MHASKIIIRTIVAVLLIATLAREHVSAAVITQQVSFTAQSSQIGVHGKVNTLAQSLGVQPFMAPSSVSVGGSLTANVTFNVSDQGNDVEVLDVEILSSTFTQGNLELFYDVPNTQRRITFTTDGINFSVNNAGSGPSALSSLQQASSAIIPGDDLQIEQKNGVAQVSITNRPSKQQNLSQQEVFSTYMAPSPSATQLSFAVTPSPTPNGYIVDLVLPLTNQQLYYPGVGLPVTLNYAGGINLLSGIVMIEIDRIVPEPSALVLMAAGSIGLMLRRSRRKMA